MKENFIEKKGSPPERLVDFLNKYKSYTTGGWTSEGKLISIFRNIEDKNLMEKDKEEFYFLYKEKKVGDFSDSISVKNADMDNYLKQINETEFEELKKLVDIEKAELISDCKNGYDYNAPVISFPLSFSFSEEDIKSNNTWPKSSGGSQNDKFVFRDRF